MYQNDEKENRKKYHYKVNIYLSYGFLKDRVIILLFSQNNRQQAIEELKILLNSHLIPICPNPTNKRNVLRYWAIAKPKITRISYESFKLMTLGFSLQFKK